MKNTLGNSISITLFGESHGQEIGAVLDGIAPGISVDEEFIRRQLSLRRPAGKISTARVESDPFRIISGVFEGKTTGTPSPFLFPTITPRARITPPRSPVPDTRIFLPNANITAFRTIAEADIFRGALPRRWLRQVPF